MANRSRNISIDRVQGKFRLPETHAFAPIGGPPVVMRGENTALRKLCTGRSRALWYARAPRLFAPRLSNARALRAIELEKRLIDSGGLTRDVIADSARVLDAFARSAVSNCAGSKEQRTPILIKALQAMSAAVDRYEVLGDDERASGGNAFSYAIIKGEGGEVSDSADTRKKTPEEMDAELPELLAVQDGFNYRNISYYYSALAQNYAKAGRKDAAKALQDISARYKRYYEAIYSLAKVIDPMTGEKLDAMSFPIERVMEMGVKFYEFWFDRCKTFIRSIIDGGDVEAVLKFHRADTEAGEAHLMADRQVRFFGWSNERLGTGIFHHTLNKVRDQYFRLPEHLRRASKIKMPTIAPQMLLEILFDYCERLTKEKNQTVKVVFEGDGNSRLLRPEIFKEAIAAVKETVEKSPDGAKIVLAYHEDTRELAIGDKKLILFRPPQGPADNEIAHPISGIPVAKERIDEHLYLGMAHELREFWFEFYSRLERSFVAGDVKEFNFFLSRAKAMEKRAEELRRFAHEKFVQMKEFVKAVEHLFYNIRLSVIMTADHWARNIDKKVEERRAILADTKIDELSETYVLVDALKFFVSVFRDLAAKHDIEFRYDENTVVGPEFAGSRSDIWSRAAEQVIWTAMTRAKSYVEIKWDNEKGALFVEGDLGSPRPAAKMRQDVRADGVALEGVVSQIMMIPYKEENGIGCYVVPRKLQTEFSADVSLGERGERALLNMGVEYFTFGGKEMVRVEHDRYWLFREGGLDLLAESLDWHRGRKDGIAGTVRIVWHGFELGKLAAGVTPVPFSLFKNIGGGFTMAVMTDKDAPRPHDVIQRTLAGEGLAGGRAGDEAYLYGYVNYLDGKFNLCNVRSKRGILRPDKVLFEAGFGYSLKNFGDIEVNLGVNGLRRFKSDL